MVNVGTGNLLLQDDDMSVPHKGIALAFRRTYNSQSQHDVAGTDGSVASMYGNGWTNTFDAHISGSSAGPISVWDIDGARYDYTLAADGVTRIAPPGQHATLTYDGTGCGYLWTKKSGTTYYFWTPDGAGLCPSWWYPSFGAYAGRLYQIIGRNRNTFITFNYSWDSGNSAAGGKISQITAQTESGLTATLAFADVSGHRLLQQLIFPDGATSVNYYYYANGDLGDITSPPNNAAGTRPDHSLGYQTLGTGTVLFWASSPRWCASACGTDGAWTRFDFVGADRPSSALSGIGHAAVVNPAIPDGSNQTVLQPGYTTAATGYLGEYFTTGGSVPTFRDTDGHAINWVVDSLGRPTQTQECTAMTNGSCTGTWLVSNETWDSVNNLASEVDPRGNQTNYMYDPAGNTIAIGEPVTATSQGTFRPTKIYDYDAFNNVVGYCDESESNAKGADWVGPYGTVLANDSLCATYGASVAHWHSTYSYPSYEPYGELTSMTTPMGYTRTFSYVPAQQGGVDYGLPTAVTGAAIAEVDGSTITPSQTFWYDGTGNLRCYSKGQGAYALSYDALGRPLSEADPDDSSANASSLCGKSTGQPGWNTQITSSYFPDGSLQSTQTPAERARNVSTTFTYDTDGDVITETHHHGCTNATTCVAGVTKKWYDGADRLVETMLPTDPTDYGDPLYNHSNWITRYLYDLSAGGLVSYLGTSFVAHGNLYKTQEVFNGQNPSIIDIKGQAFDSLDRLVTTYTVEPGGQAVRTTTKSYDGAPASLGLLTSNTDPLGEVTRYGYDEQGRASSVQFQSDGGVTPDRTMTYDPNGRLSAIHSVMLGTQQTMYDPDGRLAEVDEFTGGTQAVSSPAQLRYAYYGDGTRKTMSVTSSAVTADPLMSYAYRADGQRTLLQVTKGGVTSPLLWTYTDAGRVLTQSDPATGRVIPSPSYPISPGTLFKQKTYSYDGGGALNGVSLPVNANYSAISRDFEGSITGFLSNFTLNGATFPLTATFNVTSRGESQSLVESYTGPDRMTKSGTIWGRSAANGLMLDLPPDFGPVIPFDIRNSAPMAPGNAVIPDNCNFGQTPIASYSYDAAGRRTFGSLPSLDPDSCTNQGWQATTGFDAENHTTSYVNYYAGIWCLNARWSPRSQLTTMDVNCSGTPVTFHYDGGTLLFVSTPAHGPFGVNVETFGYMLTDNTLEVEDRDYAGLSVMRHGPAGYSGWDSTNTIQAYKFPPTVGQYVSGSTGTQPAGNAYRYMHPDGFEVEFGTVQGTRVSDRDGWTTPDAYAGEVHDPMSQKPYMWNRNNPYHYSDPSGFSPCLEEWCVDHTAGKGPELPEIGHVVARTSADQLMPDGRSIRQHVASQRAFTGALSEGMIWVLPGGAEARFAKAGIELSEHALVRLAQRSDDVTVDAIIEAYKGGRLFFDPKYRTFIRYDSKTGTTVAVDQISGGKILTVMQRNNPAARWNPVRWRPGQ